MNNEYSYLNDMQQNCRLYGMVEIDKLRSVWKARKFAIQVPDAIVQSGLLPSIFDWSLLGQLMPAEQTSAELMLQQRINDLELLNSLTTSLQRIQIVPEIGLDVDVVMGRPSYNVLVQNDGSILVKELPSLHIHVYATESRAAAGQDAEVLSEASLAALEQRKQLSALVSQKAALFVKSDLLGENRTAQLEESSEEHTELAHDPNEELGEFEEFLERTCTLTTNRSKLSQLEERVEQLEQQQDLDNSAKLELEVPPPSDACVQQVESIGATKSRRRQPIWLRLGNWLRQKLSRFSLKEVPVLVQIRNERS